MADSGGKMTDNIEMMGDGNEGPQSHWDMYDTNESTSMMSPTDPLETTKANQHAMESLDPAPSQRSTSSQPRKIVLKRQVYTQHALNEAYTIEEESFSVGDYIKRSCQCSKKRVASILLGYLPVVDVIRHYNLKTDLLSDFVSAISLSFLLLPQGLALGLLASLPAVYGLYASFFPAIVYMIFGTSRHTSFGTNALISLIIATVIKREMDAQTSTNIVTTTVGSVTTPTLTTAATTVDPIDDEELKFKVGVASAVALLCGIYLTIAGLLKFGFITNYFSPSFIGGFTTAAAFHILTSQVPKLLNIQIKSFSGAGKIVFTYIEVFKNIGDSNPADVIISIISVAFLLFMAICINQRYKDKLKVPIPSQLIIVVIATIVSHFVKLEEKFGISVVGDVPRGIPGPSLPNMDVLPNVAADAFVVAVLVFTVSISLAKLTAKIHDYSIDDNQEFLAYGVTNLVTSFFSCFASCSAPPRVMILSNVGSKSTLNGVVCILFLLIVLLAAGPLFYASPVAVLAAMICVAMKDLLLQVTQLPYFWRTSKPDFIIWMISCFVSIFADLDIGIFVGIAFSIIIVIVKNQLLSGMIGSVSTTEDLIHLNGLRSGVKFSNKFAIFHFPSQLYFATVEKFKNELFSKVINPANIPLHVEMNGGKNCPDFEEYSNKKYEVQSDCLKHIILECSVMTYMDLAGANMIKTLAGLYKKKGVTLLLANIPKYSLDLLEKIDYFEVISRDTVFHDVYDAVNSIEDTTVEPDGHNHNV